MSIKSDKWIRRMAENHGMIEPFEPRQVRENNGGRVISYGTWRYGYGIRPDACIIPPNSFALARTVEYLRIPIMC